MTYSTEAKHAAGAALIALQRETMASGGDFGEALQAALSVIVHAMISEGAPEEVIAGAFQEGIEWSVEPPAAEH